MTDDQKLGCGMAAVFFTLIAGAMFDIAHYGMTVASLVVSLGLVVALLA